MTFASPESRWQKLSGMSEVRPVAAVGFLVGSGITMCILSSYNSALAVMTDERKRSDEKLKLSDEMLKRLDYKFKLKEMLLKRAEEKSRMNNLF